jgi:signal transduction histidine kinase
MRIKIGTKLIAGFMLTIVLMVALALYSVKIGQKYLERSVGASSIFLAEEMLKTMDRELYRKIEEIQAYSRDVFLQKALSQSNTSFEKLDNIEEYVNQKDRQWVSVPKEEITLFMHGLINNELSNGLRKQLVEYYENRYGYKVFGEISVTNKYGANVAQTGKTSDYRQDDEQWWQIAKEKAFYVDNVEYDESAAMHAISIGVRVDNEQGDFIGVMRAVVSVKAIVREAEIAISRYETTTIKLTTKDGKLIYGTKAFQFLEDVSEKEFFKNMKGESGFFFAEEGARERLFSYARSKGYRDFEGLGWTLAVRHDVEEVLRPAFVLRNNIMAASLILIAAGIAIAFFISLSITRPIAKLRKSAEIIGKGDLEHRVDLQTKDEIGELAASFTHMAEDLKQAQEELIRKEKLAILGQLAGGVGHELRNPLGAIKNAAYFLNMALEKPEPEVKETLEILEKEVATSERIISSLLGFARPRAPVRRKVHVNEVIQEALSRTDIAENMELVSQLDESVPTILADPDQLAQVFGNLILNGVQAMLEGGKLTIKSKVESPNWVAVSVADTGVGIPEENLGKLFEPLFTSKAKGIGLGLAITKALVEGHGGTIEVESVEGKGSMFVVKLPLI